GTISSFGDGGGLFADSSSQVTILNNTFVSNSASKEGGAVSATLATLVNNIIAGNGSGVMAGTGSTLRHNLFHANGPYHVMGVDDPIGTDGNLEADPLLAGPLYGEVHIQPES